VSLPPDPRDVYRANDPPEGGSRRLKHQLVREVKRVNEAVALLDLEGVGPDELQAFIGAARALADQLEAKPSLSRYGGLATAPFDDAALMERSGISGRSNPLAPPLHLKVDDQVTRGHATYTTAYEGPPGCLHGGFVAAAFDDLMGLAQMASGQAGYTGTLTVRMRRPTPLRRRIDYEAGVSRVEGRKTVCWGKAWDGDQLLAEAEILFVAPKQGQIVPHQQAASPEGGRLT
jgi:acyl-coenzyme A thioesterase PaaI-like protein